ncbi:CBS domain-containing protein, partial [Candidatus Gottesmanbacteria bacterium]|nr:CBS domain-containing protein [Candidatus Gottesmanbacteria bacterium]
MVKSLVRLVHTKVFPDTPVSKVWQLLAKRYITLLAVVSADNKLLGVIGEDDLLYRLVPDYREYFSEFLTATPDLKDIEENLEKEIRLTASDVMNKKVISIAADQPIFKAFAKMMVYKVRAMPVVDEKDKFLGMIVEDDIMQFLFKKH